MKKLSILLIAALAVLGANAQNSAPGKSTTFVKNGFGDNWFVGAGVGANIYFGDKDADADLSNRFTVAPNIQLAKWFSPILGARLKISGGTNIHTFNSAASVMSRQQYIAPEANLLLNVSNYFLNYDESRVYSFIPFAGVGYAYTGDFKNFPSTIKTRDHVNSLTVDLGIINQFRLSDALALQAEFSAKALKDEFDARSGGKRGYDVLGTATASLIYNFGGTTTFSQAVLRNQGEIDQLNATINAQRAEITQLSQRPQVALEPEVIIKEVIKEVAVDKGNEPVNNVVLFKINTTKIDPMQEVNIYNVAQYLKSNTDMKVRIVGYTDTATGTAAINEKLSRERAKAVGDVITGKYGIEESRVIIDWKGQTQPPFGVDEWNRAVIMYLESVK